jgi:hypothetical protein
MPYRADAVKMREVQPVFAISTNSLLVVDKYGTFSCRQPVYTYMSNALRGLGFGLERRPETKAFPLRT